MSDTAVERAKATLEKRVGPCINQACSFGCEAYARAGYADGFDICVCTHTQHSHSYEERKVEP